MFRASLSHHAGSMLPLLTPLPSHACLLQISPRPAFLVSQPAPPARGLRPPPPSTAHSISLGRPYGRMAREHSFPPVSAQPPASLPRSIRANPRATLACRAFRTDLSADPPPPPPPPTRVRAPVAGACCARLGAEAVGGRRCVPPPPRDPGAPNRLPHLRVGCTVPRITLVKSGKAEADPTVEIDLTDAQVAAVVLGE